MGNVLTESIKRTAALWETTAYTFDELGEETEISAPGPNGSSTASVTTMTYTPTGERWTVTNADGGVTTYGYNVLGEETSETDPAPDPVNHPTVRPVTQLRLRRLGPRDLGHRSRTTTPRPTPTRITAGRSP